LAADRQQSPVRQQNPLRQLPAVQSEASSQGLPSGASARQVPSQCASGSQPASVVHVVGQVGWTCWVAPVHRIDACRPQVAATTVPSQALSSGRSPVLPQIAPTQDASTRCPWHVAGSSQVGGAP
jgi:hypothetical protein